MGCILKPLTTFDKNLIIFLDKTQNIFMQYEERNMLKQDYIQLALKI